MADNINVKDAAAATIVLATKDLASVHIPKHVNVDTAGVEVPLAAGLGSVTEAAPASDTASSGLNGRLQRIAQRLTSLIALMPAALGQGTMAQSMRVVVASDQSPIQAVGSAAAGATDSGNPVKVGGLYTTSIPTLTTGQRGDALCDVRGNLRTLVTLASLPGADGVANSLAGVFQNANSGSSSGLYPSTMPLNFNGTTWDRERKPNATSRIVSAAANTNATSAKATAGDLCFVSGHNASASVRYLKFYNKASAPTVGTDTPVLTIPLAPMAYFSFPMSSFYFSTGIAYALTTGSADADSGALTAGDVVGLNVAYA